MGNIIITSNNIRDLVGRQVLDLSSQNDYGIGVIVSTFEYSGGFGCRVHYTLDRLKLKEDGAMEGMQDYVSSPGNSLNNGGSYIEWGRKSTDYVGANPTERGASLKGMLYDPQYHSGAVNYSSESMDFKLVREQYYDDTIEYYPENVYVGPGISGTISQLRIV